MEEKNKSKSKDYEMKEWGWKKTNKGYRLNIQCNNCTQKCEKSMSFKDYFVDTAGSLIELTAEVKRQICRKFNCNRPYIMKKLDRLEKNPYYRNIRGFKDNIEIIRE